VAIFKVCLVAHISFGVLALILGPVAMFSRKIQGIHTNAGEWYHWTVAGVCLTASLMAILDWSRLWWFLPIAIGSYAFAFVGYLSAKVRWRKWLGAHISGQGGSYIAMTTALLVVNWHSVFGSPGVYSPWAWALPTVVGSPILAWLKREVALGRRPKI
jgi:hypothetical protein